MLFNKVNRAFHSLSPFTFQVYMGSPRTQRTEEGDPEATGKRPGCKEQGPLERQD